MTDFSTVESSAQSENINITKLPKFGPCFANVPKNIYVLCFFFRYANIKVIKAIVHLKINILSFSHTRLVPILYEFLSLLKTKGDILKNVNNQTVDGSHWLPWYPPPPPAPDYGSQWLPSTVWLLTFFKISSFVFSSFINYIQVWRFPEYSETNSTKIIIIS